jgi:hypothetical protein
VPIAKKIEQFERVLETRIAETERAIANAEQRYEQYRRGKPMPLIKLRLNTKTDSFVQSRSRTAKPKQPSSGS